MNRVSNEVKVQFICCMLWHKQMRARVFKVEKHYGKIQQVYVSHKIKDYSISFARSFGLLTLCVCVCVYYWFNYKVFVRSIRLHCFALLYYLYNMKVEMGAKNDEIFRIIEIATAPPLRPRPRSMVNVMFHPFRIILHKMAGGYIEPSTILFIFGNPKRNTYTQYTQANSKRGISTKSKQARQRPQFVLYIHTPAPNTKNPKIAAAFNTLTHYVIIKRTKKTHKHTHTHMQMRHSTLTHAVAKTA